MSALYEIASGIGNTSQRKMQNHKDMVFNLQAYISTKIRLLEVSHYYCMYCIELNYIVSSQPCNIIPMNEVVQGIGNITYNANDKDVIFYKRIRSEFRLPKECIIIVRISLNCIT